MPDLRWGALFLDENTNQVHTIYLDGKYVTGTGRKGLIDGHAVALNRALIEWFESQWRTIGDKTTP